MWVWLFKDSLILFYSLDSNTIYSFHFTINNKKNILSVAKQKTFVLGYLLFNKQPLDSYFKHNTGVIQREVILHLSGSHYTFKLNTRVDKTNDLLHDIYYYRLYFSYLKTKEKPALWYNSRSTRLILKLYAICMVLKKPNLEWKKKTDLVKIANCLHYKCIT